MKFTILKQATMSEQLFTKHSNTLIYLNRRVEDSLKEDELLDAVAIDFKPCLVKDDDDNLTIILGLSSDILSSEEFKLGDPTRESLDNTILPRALKCVHWYLEGYHMMIKSFGDKWDTER